MQSNKESTFKINKEPVIKLDKVRKKYRLFKSKNDRIKEAFSFGLKKYHKEYWALDNISLSVYAGETIGVLGRNGSGKSTLLQILSSVMTETTGNVVVKGRVAALLELGAGFNKEFTGRDNVIMNGVLQGIAEKEMYEKIDEIRAFADIGEFFDQPVGSYSSGMFVRLGFAAAISVEPKILILDEALGVGDILFQEKCYLKIRELQKKGVTIIIVSHSTSIIERLCERAVVLDKGKLIYCGSANDAVNQYDELMFSRNKAVLNNQENNTNESISNNSLDEIPKDEAIKRFMLSTSKRDQCKERRSYNKNEVRFGNGYGEIIDYLLVADEVVDPKSVVSGAKTDVYIKLLQRKKLNNPSIGLGLFSHDGIMLSAANTTYEKINLKPVNEENIFVCKLSFNFLLNEGQYFIHIGLTQKKDVNIIHYDMRRSVASINVLPTTKYEGICNLGFSFTNTNDYWREVN